MKDKRKVFFRFNIMTMFFIAVSFISVTLAWFAFSGITNIGMEIPVKAWLIELTKDEEKIYNDVIFSSSEIKPGMETISEVVEIKNLGDSDADIKYSIVSARIFDEELINDTTTSSEVEEMLSQKYPFHININLSKNYALASGDESKFEVSISWPLDSGEDDLDSLWGNKSYDFKMNEELKKSKNEDYRIKPPIQIIISLAAEQYLEVDDASDTRFDLGDQVLYDVVSNERCEEISSTCLSTHIIDVNNKRNDATVTLFPNPYSSYLSGKFSDYDDLLETTTGSWEVTTRPLLIQDIVKVISTDITGSLLVRDGLSDSVIGNLNNKTNFNKAINRLITYSGHYQFKNKKFSYLSSTTCYWVKKDDAPNTAFAVQKIDETNAKLYVSKNNEECNTIPVIVVSKSRLSD